MRNRGRFYRINRIAYSQSDLERAIPFKEYAIKFHISERSLRYKIARKRVKVIRWGVLTLCF